MQTKRREVAVVRPDGTTIGRQGLNYTVGISAESVGARGLHLQALAIPRGSRARAHKHPGHETAIYATTGVSGCWYGDRLEDHLWLRAGEFLYIPADVAHLTYNPSSDADFTAVIARTDPNEQEHVVLLPELDDLPHLRDQPNMALTATPLPSCEPERWPEHGVMKSVATIDIDLRASSTAAGANEPQADVAPGLTDPAFVRCPHALLDRLRIEEPVHQDRVFDRAVLTRAGDVAALLADRTLSVDPYKARPTAFGRLGLLEEERGRQSLVFLDDPDHARLRRLVTQAFSARVVEAQRASITAMATTLIDAFDSSGRVCLVDTYARPLPIAVIAGMLGIDPGRAEKFKRWSDDAFLFFEPRRSAEQERQLRSAINDLNECFATEIADRRTRPRDDLIGGLVAAQAGDDRLTDLEIVDTCRALLTAGNVTTTDLIANGVVALLRHPEQIERLKQEPKLWPTAVEEILRHDPPVVGWNRHVLEPWRIGGRLIDAGQTVTAMLLAANHDPELHADPHAFDIGREGQKHYSFGGGVHFCLGASLARLEAEVALRLLFVRFPGLHLDGEHQPRRKTLPGFGGYDTVRLRTF